MFIVNKFLHFSTNLYSNKSSQMGTNGKEVDDISKKFIK